MSINISKEIARLIQFGIQKELLQPVDQIYVRNRMLAVLGLDAYEDVQVEEENLSSPVPILENILSWAAKHQVLASDTPVFRDLLDTKIMNCLMPRPSEVIHTFEEIYEEDPVKATDYYYELSKNSNYIRTDRVAKNQVWQVATEYGDFDITINLSKPEKDPKAIAAAKNMPSSTYPKCLLCKENEGYEGRLNHPARGNHRVIPIRLKSEDWFLQYSPYVYYNEHCIVFKASHEPMKISKATFQRLIDFVEFLPHYFVGSNADLPIVGGSILSHDHFQGGHYNFAMAKAPVEETFTINGFDEVELGIVKWPMSVIRLRGEDKVELVTLADLIFKKWQGYSDESVELLAYTEATPHNTITPIARKRDGLFELDLVLRNNRTNEIYPDGIFHPHKEIHHIKKENIGLIEVMGLAVLPARLKEELGKLAYYLTHQNEESKLSADESIHKHLDWYKTLKMTYTFNTEQEVREILNKEVGTKFKQGLEHAGVFKRDDKGKAAFIKFIKHLNV